MSKATITIDWEGKPLSELQRMIAARRKWLGESGRDAVVATAITVVRSLRADTRAARKKAKNSDIEVTDTGWTAGWIREGGKFRRCVRGHRNVRPVNRAGAQYVKGEKVKVFKVVPVFHKDDWRWEKNRNAADRCWYVFAQSRKVAVDFGKERMQRYLDRWRNLGKLALGFAMAKLSTRGGKVEPSSAKARKAAETAASVMSFDSADNFSIVIVDALDYAIKALKSGPGGVGRAMKKAANSIAGRIRKAAGGRLDEALPTPFPEVKGARR